MTDLDDVSIGYCVVSSPNLASFRLRVDIPSKNLGMKHVIGAPGDVTFFFKGGNPELAKRLKGPIVFDVVNAHFADPDYRRMIELATVVTCSSEVMAGMIRDAFGREAIVIADPYENEERPARVQGGVLWFGHQVNLRSLEPYRGMDIGAPFTAYTGEDWSLEGEVHALDAAGVVFLTANNPAASSNRAVKALRAGRFVVAPEDCPQSWRDLSDFIWIGDVREGIRWAFGHREEACRKVQSAQSYISKAFSPQAIGSRWADLFASTLQPAPGNKRAG